MSRKKPEQEPADEQASITIEADGLSIGTKDGYFKLPKDAVDQLVSSLLISGFGPQTPAQYNTILAFRDMKAEQVA